MYREELTHPNGHVYAIKYASLHLAEYRRGLKAMREFISKKTDELPSIEFEYSTTRPRGRWIAKPSRKYWASAGTSLWTTTLAIGERLQIGSHRITVSAPNNSGIGIESSMLREMMIKHMDGAFGL